MFQLSEPFVQAHEQETDYGHSNVSVFVAFFAIFRDSRRFGIELLLSICLIEFFPGVAKVEENGAVVDVHCCHVLVV